MYRTEQDRIDAETMRLDNPERVVGSGFIQFPPQVAFQRPVTRQPPTMTEYDDHTNSHYRQGGGHDRHQSRPRQGGRAGYQGGRQYGAEGSGRNRAPQGSAHRGSQHSAYQGAQAGSQQYQNDSGASGQQAHGGQSGSGQLSQQRVTQQQHRSRGQERQQHAINGTSQPGNHGPPPTSGQSNTARLPENTGPVHSKSIAAAKASAVPTGPSETQEKPHLSKSQAKRLRKKMREGKMEV